MDAHSGGLDDAERFKLLVNAVTDYAIYMIDTAGNVASWNAGAVRFKGYTADEIIGRHFSKFYTPEDQQAGVPAFALATAREKGKFEAEGWRVRKDGTRFWAHVVIDPIRNSSGHLLGFAKITRDLTERLQAQQTLTTSHEQFRLLVNSVTDYAIYMLDLKGNVSSWNAGAQRIKGFAPDEIIGQHFSRFYTDEDRAAGLPDIALSTAAREGRYEKEGWRVRKDGSRFWANVVIDPIRGPDGHIQGYAKVTRDITERLDNEKRLEEAREALFQSQKLEAVGKLTGGVAHDFNNLLSAVIGSLELAQKRLGPDPRVDALLANAMQAAERGTSLTQRMLAFARRSDLKPQSVDVRILLRGMIDMLSRSLGPNVEIATHFPISLKPTRVDPNQLEMAVINLAVNARDAMPDGGPIDIAVRDETVGADNGLGLKPGAYVALSVEDHGTGMDDATLQRATEPFFTTKGVGKGTGLGLSMALGLAEQSGGGLQIRTKPGQGTMVSFWLPAAEMSDQQVPVDRGSVAPPPGPTPLNILAVDDDALVLLNTAMMLEDLGHTVATAYSGATALKLLGEMNKCDLLITDQGMPGMTGAQLIADARALRPGLPVILATGYAELPEETALGVPRLAKPFFQHQLATIVNAVAKQHSG